MPVSSATRREFLRAALPGWLGARSLTATENRPNLIILFADDYGYGDIGCYGGADVKTPNIDSIARNGVRFTDGYVAAALCSPSARRIC